MSGNSGNTLKIYINPQTQGISGAVWMPGVALNKIFLLVLGRSLVPRGRVGLGLLVGAVRALVSVQVNPDHHQHGQQRQEHQRDHHCGGSSEKPL